jgi:pilus assembly protein FimV
MQKIQKTPLVAAMLVAGVLWASAPAAYALGLGTAKVLSPIGQPLLAEIDITDITAEEASNLQVKVPGPDAFKAAGVDYSRIAADVQVTLQKRANGRSYLRLASNQTVTDPFLDLVVEANWGNGRVVRDYTLLLDPPSSANPVAAAIAPTASVLAPVTPVARSVPAPVSRTQAPVRTDVSTGEPAKPAARAARPVAPVAVPSITGSGQTYTVQGGDTLSKIANQYKPSSVSLDQMLAALYQSNQSSFTSSNINRLQKGVVLQLPSEGSVAGIAPAEARKIVVAQSKDFGAYRANLAKAVSDKPAVLADGSQRSASGKVDTKVQDTKSTAAQPDKLTLSKGQVAGKADKQVAQVATAREAKASQDRMAEINRNVSELSKIAAASAPVAASTASKPAAPGINVPVAPVIVPPVTAASKPVLNAPAVAASAPKTPEVTPAVVVASAPVLAASVAAPQVIASSPVSVSAASMPVVVAKTEAAPVVAAPAPVAVAKKPVAAPEPEPSFIESITNNDLFIPGLGALALGLAGLGVWRLRKRKSSGDSSAFDSQVQGTDSFFGGTGGARVDTRDSVLASSMYSSSQLNANEVDPVAEADVYLAYGRDLQAEEILKEALRAQPERHSIRVKLLEIYAKRRDARSFEVIATELFSMTQGQGEDWTRAVELGRELEPANALYNTQVGSSQLMTGSASDFGSGASPFDSPTTLPASRAMSSGFAPTDINSARTTLAPDSQMNVDALNLDLDLDLGGAPAPSASSPSSFSSAGMGTASVASAADSSLDALSFDMPSSLMSPKTAPAPAPASAMEFDMSKINLDLQGPSSGVMDDPYETKFALAEECQRLGDKDSARSILREIVDMATGSIRSKAEKMLGDIR